MKRLIKAFFNNEILSYLFFGGATTLVSIVSRLVIYHISHQEILATALANIIGILFAFLTNLKKREGIGQPAWLNLS